MEKPDLKAGMLVEYENGDKFLVVPKYNGNLVGFGVNCNYWASGLDSPVKIGYPSDYYRGEKTEFGIVLWEKSKEVVLTMDEIAKKFNVSVEQLKIKK